jgi:hypothetical protein
VKKFHEAGPVSPDSFQFCVACGRVIADNRRCADADNHAGFKQGYYPEGAIIVEELGFSAIDLQQKEPTCVSSSRSST